MHLSMLAPTSPHPGQGGEFSLFGMADLPQGSGKCACAIRIVLFKFFFNLISVF